MFVGKVERQRFSFGPYVLCYIMYSTCASLGPTANGSGEGVILGQEIETRWRRGRDGEGGEEQWWWRPGYFQFSPSFFVCTANDFVLVDISHVQRWTD